MQILALFLLLLATTSSLVRGSSARALAVREPRESVPEDSAKNLSNLALNQPCYLSSSSHSMSKRYASRLVDGDAQTDVETLNEASGGYVLIDLGAISYVDEIVIFQKSADQDLTVSLADKRNTSLDALSWYTTIIANPSTPSVARVALHVHSSGRWVKVQRAGRGKLWLQEVQVLGSRLGPNDLSIRSCLTGHEGLERCSNHGACDVATGACACDWFWEGARCETSRHDMLVALSLISAFVLYLVLLPAKVWCWRLMNRHVMHRYTTLKQDNHRDEDLAARCEAPSPPPLARHPGVHVFFASPLVVFNDNGTITPVPQLNLAREIALLKLSFEQSDGMHVPINVSVATADALMAAVSMPSFADVLHVSSHCESEFIVLESEAGLAHVISIRQLAGLLNAGLNGKTSLRLVVLNSCHSQHAGQAFVDAGVPHVIALAADAKVSDAGSTVFTRALYLALASGRSIHDAFCIATHSVELCGQRGPLEAAAFRLLPPSDTEHRVVLWPKTETPSAAPPRRLPSTSSSSMTPSSRLPAPGCEDLVGRHLDLWHILNGLFVRKRRLCVGYGDSGVGKTELAVALLHYFEQRNAGDVAALVDAKDDPSETDLVGRVAAELSLPGRTGLVVIDHVPRDVLCSKDFVARMSGLLKQFPRLHLVIMAADCPHPSGLGELPMLGFSIHVGALSSDDSRKLLERLLGGPVILDNVVAAQGNPRLMRRVASKIAFAGERSDVRVVDVERLM